MSSAQRDTLDPCFVACHVAGILLCLWAVVCLVLASFVYAVLLLGPALPRENRCYLFDALVFAKNRYLFKGGSLRGLTIYCSRSVDQDLE